ncbi:MAG: tRNA-dihydrouridine synthase, partial [Halioglobus sp.]|nr:tRNA-dihydrouridine synthase [Halioglobus sp.]
CSGFNPAGMMKGNFFTRGMNADDMQRVTAQFVAAAEQARDAGFDAVELHMGHGYLLNQFISPLNNRREDEYGGSAENRVRFPAQVLKAVKGAVGKEIAVLAKINVSDGVRRGADQNDAIVTARALEAAGADMLVLSGGRNVESTWFMFGSNMNREAIGKMLRSQRDWIASFMIGMAAQTEPRISFKEMYFLEYSRAIRKAVSVPLAYLGGVKSLANAEQAMDEGFECVVLARALLHEPALVNKFQSGELEISGCDNCNACVAYIYHPDGTRCVHRPKNDPALTTFVSTAR